MILIDGKKTSEKIRAELAEEVKNMPSEVGLAVIIVGDDAASQVYVRNKEKACQQLGIQSYRYSFPSSITEQEPLRI